MKNKPRSLPAANNGVSSLLVLIASLLTTAECTIDVLIEGFFKNKEINKYRLDNALRFLRDLNYRRKV